MCLTSGLEADTSECVHFDTKSQPHQLQLISHLKAMPLDASDICQVALGQH